MCECLQSQDVDVSVDLTQNSITFRKRGKDTVLGVIPGRCSLSSAHHLLYLPCAVVGGISQEE